MRLNNLGLDNVHTLLDIVAQLLCFYSCVLHCLHIAQWVSIFVFYYINYSKWPALTGICLFLAAWHGYLHV